MDAYYADGYVFVSMETGVEIKFPVAKNPRLRSGTAA